jgi:hypothetical protein
MGAVLYGYDGTYFTGVVAMNGFLRRFGDTVENGAPALKSGTLSLIASIVQVGELIGSLLATVVGGIGGRRGGLIVACALVTLGCIIQISATSSIAQITVGRLVLGMFTGACCSHAYDAWTCRNGHRPSFKLCPSLPLRVVAGHCPRHCGRLLATHARDWSSHRRWRCPGHAEYPVPVHRLMADPDRPQPRHPPSRLQPHLDHSRVSSLARLEEAARRGKAQP